MRGNGFGIWIGSRDNSGNGVGLSIRWLWGSGGGFGVLIREVKELNGLDQIYIYNTYT